VEKAPEAGKEGEEVHEVKAPPAPARVRPKTRPSRRPVATGAKEAPSPAAEDKDTSGDKAVQNRTLRPSESDQEGM